MKKKRPEKMLVLKQMIESGETDEALADYDFNLYCSVYRSLTHYRFLLQKPRDFKTEVIVIHGPTGTGKSKYCFDNFPDAYWKCRSNWWDGYLNQEVVIMDEFYGWIQFDLLLRMCDRYPLIVETKGGHVQFRAKTIVFTTNSEPSTWYKNVYFPSFVRRVDKWMVMPVWGETTVYYDYSEAISTMINNTFMC